jgi:IS5 family transposase
MLRATEQFHQTSFFGNDLIEQLDPKDPLLLLAKAIPWREFDEAFISEYTQGIGRPSIPIRVMVGLLILKQLENLSDERVVLAWKQNPYYQAFCGIKNFQNTLPCHATELVHFRKRIGTAGVEKIFAMSVRLQGAAIEEAVVNVDSTVQEKAITYPTDGKLAIKIINRLNKLAKESGIAQRRTFVKEVKQRRISLRFFRHVKKRGKAVKAIKRLRTIAGILLRELQRKLRPEILQQQTENFTLYEKVLAQKKNDKDKIYSLHEPQVYCVAKGKDHKPYEYGAKASLVTTAKGNIILSAVSHAKNIVDGHTLDEVLAKAQALRNTSIQEAVCDRGYRGRKAVNGVKIVLPQAPKQKDTRYERDKQRAKCRRRAAIEPIIGHLKSSFRLAKNYLKGVVGDEINLLMAACAWNLRKWMISALEAFFCCLKNGYDGHYDRVLRTLKRSGLFCIITITACFRLRMLETRQCR